MLLSILIISAIGSAIAVSLLLLGLSSSQNSFSLQQSYQAKSLADTCAEEGLEQIRNLSSFTGAGNLTLSNGTCSYTVANLGGENRTVSAIGYVGDLTKRIKVVIDQINPQINIISWQEVAGF
ncbi:hypothetical protein HOD96_03415 [Candidatus Falkowbacteria bacterium]|nr:hypothetical protein [Candidatus Falkowbacteria bacterium]MBT4432977.1 hypothetical protein [Candidatus Falkowbacteria bacterium]